MVHIIIKVFD